MELLVDLSKPLVGYMSVNLSRADVAMSQHHLYRSQVGAIFKQMSGEAVSEEMRRNMTNPSLFTVGHYHFPKRLAS